MTVTVEDPSRLVAALRQVRGVADAGLDPDGDGVGMLRLDLDPGVDEAEVAAAAGRLLREQFGLGVDEDAVALLEESWGGGPQVERVGVLRVGRSVTAAVTLTTGEGESHGEADGSATATGVLRAVAEATLAAALPLCPAGTEAALIDLVHAADGPTRRLAVTVRVTDPGGGLPGEVPGIAGVGADARQAAVRAVLAALGKRLVVPG